MAQVVFCSGGIPGSDRPTRKLESWLQRYEDRFDRHLGSFRARRSDGAVASDPDKCDGVMKGDYPLLSVVVAVVVGDGGTDGLYQHSVMCGWIQLNQ